MGIQNEIELITKEFVPVCVLIDALIEQEGVTPYKLSLWLERNMNAIERLPVLDYSYDEKDFVWRNSLRDAIGDCGFSIYSADGDFDFSLFASFDNENFVPGWRATDLRDFFSTTSVEYPEQAIDDLLKEEHWRIAIEAREEVQQAELQWKLQAVTPPQEAPQEESCRPVGRWPWGDHHTEALGHLEAAGLRFWQWFDPTDPTTAETNETVIEWLVTERGVTRDKARSIASLLRADGLPPGPRRK